MVVLFPSIVQGVFGNELVPQVAEVESIGFARIARLGISEYFIVPVLKIPTECTFIGKVFGNFPVYEAIPNDPIVITCSVFIFHSGNWIVVARSPERTYGKGLCNTLIINITVGCVVVMSRVGVGSHRLAREVSGKLVVPYRSPLQCP